MSLWLLAFLLHSTLWCSLAWLLTRARTGAEARVRETVWYTALAASMITPTVHAVFAPAASWGLAVPEQVLSAGAGEHDGGSGAWWGVAYLVGLVIACGLVLRYVMRLAILRGRLRRREPVADEAARRTLGRLCAQAGLRPDPRLTSSEDLGSPIAFGFGRRREICVPARAIRALREDELSAMLGHEVAHHLRRDSLRLAFLNTLRAAFFFQPLFRLAVRALRDAAEEQCDDWAASQLGDRFAMASCLTEVASWSLERDRDLPVPCMARRRSQLGVRVDRLLDDRNGAAPSSGRRRHVWAVATLALASLCAPGVRAVGEEHASREREHHSGEHEHRGEHAERSHR